MPARVKLTIHAQTQLIRRGITPDAVKSTILTPNFTENAYDGKMKAHKKLENGKELVVVYSKDGFRKSNDYFIVTAYYLEP